jgi:DNA-binding CsgD family transcriptional regulator/5-methylcytosine-specific restriction endonuclease McrA
MFVQVSREAIAALHQSGLSVPAIARELDLAPTTVSYHIERLQRDPEATIPAGTPAPREAVTRSTTRAEVARMLALGMQRADIARRLGVSKATVSYHAARLGQSVDERCARRYDWRAVQEYYDAGHSVRSCIQTFGFSAASWSDAVRRGAVVARPNATPIAELLVADTYRGRYNLKLRLLREGLKEDRCERCGVTDWCEEPLTLALHHVNGKRNDNRLENLQLLCPNCHSQTRNYAGRNGREPKPSAGVFGGADDAAAPPDPDAAVPPDADAGVSQDTNAAATSGADITAGSGAAADGALRSNRDRSTRRRDRRRGRRRRSRRSGAGGRARGRRSGRQRGPPSRGHPVNRRS